MRRLPMKHLIITFYLKAPHESDFCSMLSLRLFALHQHEPSRQLFVIHKISDDKLH